MKRYIRKYSVVVVCGLLALSATSCKIGKSYVRPELNMPEQIVDNQVR